MDGLLHPAIDVNRCVGSAIATLLIGSVTSCATFGNRLEARDTRSRRASIIARSQVWSPTNVPAVDFTRGPQGSDAFPFHATVECDYLPKKLDGKSPKFACTIAKDDELKVKFGGTNGEVYGEVLATRLLWGLGFGADRMYPVNVICRGCPADLLGIERPNNESRFDPATVERKMEGREVTPEGKSGWSWKELDAVDPEAGGAPRAHRDALKLLAVFMQHSDTKPQQQRILCLDEDASRRDDSCARPILMINDLGLTFGRASRSNINEVSSVNLTAWRETPVWKGETGCTGNLPKSLTGTLDNPVVSEDGRRFLAGLLSQLTDGQLHDLFEAGRVQFRLRTPGKGESGFATVQEWVNAFKDKRRQVLERRCT
jgi:hypothetical protein